MRNGATWAIALLLLAGCGRGGQDESPARAAARDSAPPAPVVDHAAMGHAAADSSGSHADHAATGHAAAATSGSRADHAGHPPPTAGKAVPGGGHAAHRAAAPGHAAAQHHAAAPGGHAAHEAGAPIGEPVHPGAPPHGGDALHTGTPRGPLPPDSASARLLDLVAGLLRDPVVQEEIQRDSVLRRAWADTAVRRVVQPK